MRSLLQMCLLHVCASLFMYTTYILTMRAKTNVRWIKGGMDMTVGDINYLTPPPLGTLRYLYDAVAQSYTMS